MSLELSLMGCSKRKAATSLLSQSEMTILETHLFLRPNLTPAQGPLASHCPSLRKDCQPPEGQAV